MIRITVENEELSVTMKDADAYSIEDCVDLLSRAMSAVWGEDIELKIDLFEDDKAIYIEPDQPKDHIEHEGM